MLIGRGKGQWVLLGTFSLFLGITFVRGSPVKGLTIVEEVEKKNFVCWSVTLCLGGNPMFSGSWCWFRTLQRYSGDGVWITIELGVPIDEEFL